MKFTDFTKLISSGEKIFNLNLRVCYYARVSTDNDIQINSLDNQTTYYENYIKNRVNWTFVKGYIDEGKSGVRVEKRDGFKQMINDALLHKFDLIVTKEVSRFARDLEDSIHYIRLLKDANVGVYFENQNLNTFDVNSELILNIMFNLAQDESRKLSSRIKFGHNEAIKKGHVLGSSNIIGYRKNKCKLVINEDEALFIKKVYELYATGLYGLFRLSNKLGELGFFNKKNSLYDKDTLKRIIANPKYKGYYRGKTTEVVDYRTKKRNKVDLENQVIFKCNDGSVPAIVSEELWDEANKVLKSRTSSSLNSCYSKGLKYPFSSKIYCAEHNRTFQRSHGNKNKKRPTWCCSNYLHGRLEACESPIIAEVDLYNIFSIIMGRIIGDKTRIVDEMIKMYESVHNSNDYDLELKKVNNMIRLIQDKKGMALDLLFQNVLTKEELKYQFQHYEKELQKLCNQKSSIKEQMKLVNNNRDLKESIEGEFNGGILEEFIKKFVSKVIVSKINGDRHYIKLDIYMDLLGVNNALDIKNLVYTSVEKLRSDRIRNCFIIDIYYKKTWC